MDGAAPDSLTNTALPEKETGESPNETGIFWAGLASILIFYVAILIVGTVASYFKKSYKGTSEDMMLAGRNIGMVIGIFTMTSSWVGGGFVNGTSEKMVTPGYRLAWCQAPFAYSCSCLLGGLFFAKRMRQAGYATILDPFQDRYGAVMTTFLYIPAFLGDVFWSGSILNALGSSLTVVVGLSHEYAVIISGSVAISYTLIGGLYSVSFTDVIQLGCMFGGLFLVVPFAMTHEAVSPIADMAHGGDGWVGTLTWDKSMSMWVDTGLLLLLGGIPWQVYYQRVLSQKTVRGAQVLSIVACFVCLIFIAPPLLIGAVAVSTDWNKTDYPQGIGKDYALALPLVIRYLTPTAVGVIGLGAVSAAVMSSADSSILSSGSMFARNVYQPLRNRITVGCGQWRKMLTASDTEVIWVMRGAIVVVGCVAMVLAITVESIYNLFVLCADFPYVILLPQLACVLYLDFTNTYGSAAGYALGLFFRLAGGEVMFNWKPLIPYPMYDDETGIQYFPFKTFSMLLNLFGIILVSWLTRFVFKNRILSEKADVFGCFIEESNNEKPKDVPEQMPRNSETKI